MASGLLEADNLVRAVGPGAFDASWARKVLIQSVLAIFVIAF